MSLRAIAPGYSDADLVDEIVGMANTQGGDLYLGVEDDGEITGVGKKKAGSGWCYGTDRK